MPANHTASLRLLLHCRTVPVTVFKQHQALVPRGQDSRAMPAVGLLPIWRCMVCVRLQVFSGEVDESVRHEQQLLEGEVMRMLRLLDVSINHQVLHQATPLQDFAPFFRGG